MNRENELVSVCVLTYNSARFIVEALDSVGRQGYRPLELIVCDDASTDNSVAICREWMANHGGRFVRTELFVNEKNRGIAPTRNFAVRQAQGVWIKFLDSDDVLAPRAIDAYADAMTGESHFIAGNYVPFDEAGERAVERNRVTLPALILRRDTFLKLGGFDERFPMLEDMPFFAKARENGYGFEFVDETVVFYRCHWGSIQLSDRFRRSHIDLVEQVLVPRYKKEGRYVDYWHDKWWCKRERASLDGRRWLSLLIRLLMLISDGKEWYYVVRDGVWRPGVYWWRARKR
jgi:alpha-1,3-rhamnosyltransferase